MEPPRGPVPVHSWLLPWHAPSLLPDEELQPLFASIRTKLAFVLQDWHPSDSSALTVIAPWQRAFRDADLQTMLGARPGPCHCHCATAMSFRSQLMLRCRRRAQSGASCPSFARC